MRPPSSPIRLLIHGARGKMGARLCELARRDARFAVVAEIDVNDALRAAHLAPDSIDAIADFSADDGARHAAQLAVAHGAALLVGTTGLSPDSLDIIEVSARTCPVMIAANTALGVAVMHHLIAEAARLLGPSFEIDLVETHHASKKDAPSGTALRLIETLRAKAGVRVPPERVQSRRVGDVVGEHTVQFTGPGEKIVILHDATTRDVFALGALRAVAWLSRQKPGRYTIEQSLGLGVDSSGPNAQKSK